MECKMYQRTVCIALCFSCFGGIFGDSPMTGLATSHGKEFLLPQFARQKGSRDQYNVTKTTIHIRITSQLSGVCKLTYSEDKPSETQIMFNSGRMAMHVIDMTSHLGTWSKAMFLNCTETVSVHVMSEYFTNHKNTDRYTFMALPVTSMSKKYLVPGVHFDYPILGIVAGSNNTHVNVNLKPPCSYTYNNLNYNYGETITFVLNELDVLQVPGAYTHCDFGGTFVQSDKPIAVFSGSTSLVPLGQYTSSTETYPPVCLQVPPITAFSSHIIVPAVTPPAKRSHLRLLASDDSTHIRLQAFNGGVGRTYNYVLQYAQVKDLQFDQRVNTVITSDKPIFVVQLAEYDNRDYATFLSYPDVKMYENSYTVSSMSDSLFSQQTLTVVSKSTSKLTVRINRLYPTGMKWTDIPTTGFSVGFMDVNQSVYHIEAKDPVFVRLDGYGSQIRFDEYGRKTSTEITYALSGGFSQKSTNNFTSAVQPRESVELHCLAESWLVIVNMNELTFSPSGASHIYIGEERCIGVQQGNLLIFNISYTQCGSDFQADNDQLRYENKIVSIRKKGNQDTIEWEQAIQCTSSSHKAPSVHIGTISQSTATLSSEIAGNLADIALYADRSFHQPLLTPSPLSAGTEVFVKVSTPVSASVLVVNDCELIAGNNRGKHGSIPLLQDGCAASNGTMVLLTRNEMTLFMFEMFDLGNDQASAYVTCDVTFCDQMDFSPRCDQRCHNSMSPVLIG